ncbi:MAG TPA: cation:proton antiporter [Pyrinomonadaceae bacterium]|nr:cation:proton antiporter [Pyrinomonadaceae bacterium]
MEFLDLYLPTTLLLFAGDAGHGAGDLLNNIGLCVIVAAVLAFLANKLKQPVLLAYLLAGVLIGPEIGFKLITDHEVIEVISEIGLVLLLFIIGLEMDLKKLRASGKPVIVTGITQFLICVALGIPFFLLLGFRIGDVNAFGGEFGLFYMSVAAAISSTMIVVKLLYDKFELDTLPGRITLGILVFQDIWAIVALALQPNLRNPRFAPLAASFGKGVLLVAASLLISRYVLPRLFRSVAKIPELVLIMALAWCFLICAAASYAGLSKEMGALIAGVSISTFPYSLDVIAKVISIRDFFVTLFFVALGMRIPMPTLSILGLAALTSLFLIASRFLSIFPVLYAMRYGHRVSLLPSINLSQISEFSLVVASLGLAMGHINSQTVSLIIFVFVITSTTSTYMISYNHQISRKLGRVLSVLRLKDVAKNDVGDLPASASKPIVFLGFYREASAIVHEFELRSPNNNSNSLLDDILVIDFNPEVHAELQKRGIECLYGDVAHMETLHHAKIHDAKLVISTIPDHILKGTDNERLLKKIRQLCPHAEAIVTADSPQRALDLYERGADFVFIPRMHSSDEVAKVIETGITDGLASVRNEQVAHLLTRDEVLA